LPPILTAMYRDKSKYRLVNTRISLLLTKAYASIIAAISLAIGLGFAFFGMRMYKQLNFGKTGTSHKRVNVYSLKCAKVSVIYNSWSLFCQLCVALLLYSGRNGIVRTKYSLLFLWIGYNGNIAFTIFAWSILETVIETFEYSKQFR
jgi:hypothetical protein